MLDVNDYGRFVADVFAAPEQYIGETIEPTYIPIENSPGSEVAAIIRQSSAEGYAVDIAAFEERHDIVFTTFERYLRDHDWNNL